MDSGVIAAVISVAGAVSVAYAGTFVAESFRRSHDAAALAAGLEGELRSYATALPILRGAFQSWLDLIDAGERDKLTFRPIERPRDLFYEARGQSPWLAGR